MRMAAWRDDTRGSCGERFIAMIRGRTWRAPGMAPASLQAIAGAGPVYPHKSSAVG